ncbi:MAG: GNAT family N-acetyltransferase [Anaerolineae bacterium]|nr:GNAT family N-acetyltransferase [Anaerolineae bacterium]MDW8173082.1 GNAT family N-acetyltransferase [Anaerolineae bacterium]
MLIRPARYTDLERIGTLWLELVRYHAALDPAMPQATQDGALRYANQLAVRLEDWDYAVFVAEVDGQVVGFITAMIVEMLPDTFEGERGGMVGDLYVQPDYRGGTGRALLEAALGWFRLRRVRYYELHVASANAVGLAFWRSAGGREIMYRMRVVIED